MMEELLEILGDELPEDWTIIDDVSVECPHGHIIEWDGTCPEGCVSIIRQMGMI